MSDERGSSIEGCPMNGYCQIGTLVKEHQARADRAYLQISDIHETYKEAIKSVSNLNSIPESLNGIKTSLDGFLELVTTLSGAASRPSASVPTVGVLGICLFFTVIIIVQMLQDSTKNVGLSASGFHMEEAK
jgi:hypothetical protein